SGNIVDIHNRSIFKGTVYFSTEGIHRIEKAESVPDQYILPGLIDAHVHIESSMLVPSRFSRLVVPRGTIGIVTDPHEIGNVLGEEGVRYMIEESGNTPLKCFFGVPSCVPSTPFESAGAVLDVDKVESLLDDPNVYCLSEMMNFPGVVNKDPGVMAKIKAAQKRNLPIDGHAPGVMGEDLQKYAAAGISTDHECFSLDEALDKIHNGMKIQVREGSAARNFEALAKLFELHPEKLMLCTDDSHPDELVHRGHIDKLIKKGIEKGIDLFALLRAASLNPVLHYGLPVGLLREGDPSDFIVVDNLSDFNVLQTYIEGTKVFDLEKGILFEKHSFEMRNQFQTHFISEKELDLTVPEGKNSARIIRCQDGELVTPSFQMHVDPGQNIISDTGEDMLKIVVVDRYQYKPVSVGLIQGFGLKKGALASSVAHDSHNVVAVGVEDADIVGAVNAVMENRGGLAVVHGEEKHDLPLPIAGLMSALDGEEVASLYGKIDEKAKEMGCSLQAPFMTLSFMSLLVIPELKIGDAGLFDVNKFSFVSLFE
ncbi:MAG: adenine deaminase, partial [Marinilabiliaceae bacterium]